MKRSKKVIFISHCLLNQNSRALGGEKSAGPIKDIMELFSESGIGIIQIPCPQMEFNGGPEWRPKTKDDCDNKTYRTFCHKLSQNLLIQIEKYLSKNYNVLGVLGVELSATCGVHQLENGHKIVPGKGILMEELEELMRKKNFQVPIIGINLNNMYSSLEKLQSLLKYS